MEATWPIAGEIDIIEAINGMTGNQVALHSTPGCIKKDGDNLQSGTTYEKDCSTGQGCIVAEAKSNSYGEGFANAGGGVYALQMEESAINVWFWSVRFSFNLSTFHEHP